MKLVTKILCALFFSVSLVEAQILTAPKPPVLSVQDYIGVYSFTYKVSPVLMTRIMNCENRMQDPTKQSDIRYNFTDVKRGIYKGERERSYGLVQIHLPDHPEISYEQATDVQFSIKYLAEQLSKGRGSMWSCY